MEPSGGRLAPMLLWGAYEMLAATWRVRRHGAEVFEAARAEGGAILAFWHGDQLCMIQPHARRGLLGMVSHSRDGELLARVLSRMGYGVVRGSSSRGGALAARGSLRAVQEQGASPALAVDGPRGPRHTVQPGVLALSALSGRPIVYVCASARPALRLKSWDQMVVPAPFARLDIAYGRMDPPTARDKHSLEAARQTLQEQMRQLSLQISSQLVRVR